MEVHAIQLKGTKNSKWKNYLVSLMANLVFDIDYILCFANIVFILNKKYTKKSFNGIFFASCWTASKRRIVNLVNSSIEKVYVQISHRQV